MELDDPAGAPQMGTSAEAASRVIFSRFQSWISLGFHRILWFILWDFMGHFMGLNWTFWVFIWVAFDYCYMTPYDWVKNNSSCTIDFRVPRMPGFWFIAICIYRSIYIYIYNVVKTIINDTIFDGLYHLFKVIWGMVYYCFYHIIYK